MITIFSNQRDKKMDSPHNQTIWHWVTPIVLSILFTGGTIMLTAGSWRQKLEDVDLQNKEMKIQLEKINHKLDNMATKEDLRDFKGDVKDRLNDRQK